jgi:hypothetical protein
MKNPRKEKGGSLEIDSLLANLRPSDEIDPENPFIRKKVVMVATTRKCRKCDTDFILHVPYDINNWMHDLCSDCILAAPITNQGYIPNKELAE